MVKGLIVPGPKFTQEMSPVSTVAVSRVPGGGGQQRLGPSLPTPDQSNPSGQLAFRTVSGGRAYTCPVVWRPIADLGEPGSAYEGNPGTKCPSNRLSRLTVALQSI